MVWYEDEVIRLEEKIKALHYNPAMLFYGSSSVRLWDNLYEDFKTFAPVNLGFGGSTLEACVYYFQRIMEPLQPAHIILYAGDNDLGDGKTPDDVLNYFIQLCELIQECFNNASVSYISIKPSMARWQINTAIKDANTVVRQAIEAYKGNMFFVDIYAAMLDPSGLPISKLYDTDGLHLSQEGYRLWKEILLTHFSSKHDIFFI